MKKTIILFISVLIANLLFAQPVITATLKPGSASNAVMVVLKPTGGALNARLSAFIFTFQVPTSVGTAPISKVKSNPLNFPAADFVGDSGTKDGFYNYSWINNSQSGVTVNVADGAEFNALELEFTDGTGAPIPNIGNQVRLAYLPNGDGNGVGGSMLFTFYVESGGNELSNPNGPYFYGATAVNSGSGSTGYSYVTANATLPVRFLSFAAVRQASNVALNWGVGSEASVKNYELEVSTNGSNFSRLATKASEGKRSYEFVDQSIARYNSLKLYYRVKQIDIDGSSTYSPVKTVRLDVKAPTALYPNPARDGFTINISYLQADQKRVQLQLVNSAGQVLETRSITRAQAVNYYYSLPPSVSSGDYLLKVFEDGVLSETKQVLIKR